MRVNLQLTSEAAPGKGVASHAKQDDLHVGKDLLRSCTWQVCKKEKEERRKE